ncbi:MAG: winged helix-turn-helix transcriptional regulator [Candidatus Aenigmarchaeota archaeon]|nr:winged helix-turn-helix transcriptional regulator [Candidatus Aenigmarchaeota archaeon]
MAEEKVLKALTSDTRRKIIKILSNGYRTPSDLSRIVNKNKSTVVEHLDKLVDAGLVYKIERPGKKWVFYKLTNKGRRMVSGQPQRIIIILSAITIFALICGSFSFYKYSYFSSTIGMEETLAKSTEQVEGTRIYYNSQNQFLLYSSIVFFAAFILGFSGIIYNIKKSKFKGVLT